jgi:MFS family permease
MEAVNEAGAIDDDRSPKAELRPQSLFQLVNLNIFWLANQFHWQALLSVVIPSMVAHFLDPRYKAINLSVVVTWGTLIAVIVNPVVGALSDHVTLRIGRRRPFLIVGTCINIIVLVLFAFSPSWVPVSSLLLVFTLLFLSLQFSNNMANAPWGAIIADNVPFHQRGLAAGFNGFFTLLGTAVGAIVAGSILGGNLPLPLYRNAIVEIFLLIAAIQTLFVIYTVLIVKETPLSREQRDPFRFGTFFRTFLFRPTRYPDLSWALLARFLMMMGVWSVFYFLVYYFGDVLGGQHVRTIILNTPFSGEQFNGVLFQPAVLLMALPTSILGGWASDRWGRKPLVYLSGGLMTIVSIIFIVFQSQIWALIAGACFGIGYGAYTSVDWALTADTLPSIDEAGKFMGLWNTMGILPQVAATAVGGVVLQVLQNAPNHFNYTVLFLLTIFYLILGTLAVWKIKSIK